MDIVRAPFKVSKRSLVTSVDLTSSICGNCEMEYVLLGLIGSESEPELIQQNGGYYCPYCGAKLESRPSNKR